MKIITWNVNGIRAVERKGELQHLAQKERPDFLLLQEIKGNREQFSPYLSANTDYDQFYHSAQKKGYAGTGMWVRRDTLKKLKNVTFSTDVPKAPNADEGRVSHLTFMLRTKTYSILSIYFPNGGKSEQAWQEKLVFFDKVLAFMNRLRQKGHVVIVGGDMNVAHTTIDLTHAKPNDGKIGFHPKERAWVDRVIAAGWIDVWRSKNPGVTEVYSYWDVVSRARERNVGWRIDYFFTDQSFARRVKDVRYMSEQMGSDHCPLLMEF